MSSKSDIKKSNKAKGDIGEEICKAHFEALGYAVERTGIEHIAPQYCNILGAPHGNYIGDVKKIQKLPDFLISRIHPRTPVTTKSGMAGKADAVFVEAKFRTRQNLDDFTDKILENYGHLLASGIHFIVYLVCKQYTLKETESEYSNEGYVFLNFINPTKSKAKGDTGWQQAGVSDRFEKYSLYQGMQAGQDFNVAYEQIVKPMLRELLSDSIK